MRLRTIMGAILIVLGSIALLYQGITYTTRKRVIDVGPIKADVDTQHTIPIEPIVGGLILASGVALVLVGRRSP